MRVHHSTMGRRLLRSGSTGIALTALGVAGAFATLKVARYDMFMTAGAVSGLCIAVGAGFGLYCWWLLLRSRREALAWYARAVGVAAACIPAALAFRLLA